MVVRSIFLQSVLKLCCVIPLCVMIIYISLCAKSIGRGRASEPHKTNSVVESTKPNLTNCFIACEQIVAQCENIIEAKCIEKSYSCARYDSSGSIAMYVDSIDIEKLNLSVSFLLLEYSDDRFKAASSILNLEEANAKIGAEILYKREYNEIKENMSDREYGSFLALLYLSKERMYHNLSGLMSAQMEKRVGVGSYPNEQTNANKRGVNRSLK